MLNIDDQGCSISLGPFARGLVYTPAQTLQIIATCAEHPAHCASFFGKAMLCNTAVALLLDTDIRFLGIEGPMPS